MIATHPQDCIEQNQTSLAELFRFLEIVAARCDHPDPAAAAAAATQAGAPIPASGSLQQRYSFTFYYESKSKGDSLQRFSVDMAVPNLMEDRLRIMASRGMETNAKAHWIAFAMQAVQKLCTAAEVAVNLQLSPDFHDIVERARQAAEREKEGKEGSRQQYSQAFDATFQMMVNLADASPLQQGKGQANPKRGITGISVYSLRERRARTDFLLSRHDKVTIKGGVSNTDAAGAVMRLRAAFIDHHDALMAYHPLWDACTIHIGPAAASDSSTTAAAPSGPPSYSGSRPGEESGHAHHQHSAAYLADAPSLAFTLPTDFSTEMLVELVETHFPRFIGQTRGRLTRDAHAAAHTDAATADTAMKNAVKGIKQPRAMHMGDAAKGTAGSGTKARASAGNVNQQP